MFWLPSPDRDLARTGTSFKTVSIEVIDSTLHVDNIRSDPRNWFALVFATLTIGSVFEIDTR